MSVCTCILVFSHEKFSLYVFDRTFFFYNFIKMQVIRKTKFIFPIQFMELLLFCGLSIILQSIFPKNKLHVGVFVMQQFKYMYACLFLLFIGRFFFFSFLHGHYVYTLKITFGNLFYFVPKKRIWENIRSGKGRIKKPHTHIKLEHIYIFGFQRKSMIYSGSYFLMYM